MSRSVYGPVGAFSITADRMYLSTQDSLYGLIEAMDQVEIRMARERHQFAGNKLPIHPTGSDRAW